MTAETPSISLPARLSRAPLLFALTIFASAYLLFQVQPLISKFILPWFGGSPAVWTTAMLFFQCTLFAGYVYAHLLTRRRSPRTQAAIHLGLLLVAAALASAVIPNPALKPTGDEAPIGRILLLLAASVGLPYFCLATTGPLIQYWYARTAGGGSVFRLYALSNVGSFLALLSFPYLFEPRFTLPALGQGWSFGFWAFALLCAGVALGVGRHRQWPQLDAVAVDADAPTETPPASAAEAPARLAWIALPALASLAFIATTDHISHDVAPEPRVWISTLALYLLTFVISFDHPRWYRRSGVALGALLLSLVLSGKDSLPALWGGEWDFNVGELRWLHLATMFLVCLMCHGELFRRRPADPRRLTEYYLWMSFGGACGGLFVALIATNLFPDYYEWSVYLVAAVALACAVAGSEWGWRRGATAGLAVALAGLILYWEDPLGLGGHATAAYVDTPLHQARNFYGTVHVKERHYRDDPSRDYRIFYSGQVMHGVQYLDPARRRQPTSYYATDSGIGETLAYAAARHPALRVAVIGLGVGTLATYARPSDDYDLYEINPQVVEVANTWFDNLASCRARSRRIILGDARLKFEELPADVLYDVIALDAFSGDSVPIHLLTREAFRTYRQHLKPGGFIAVHITNSYLNLYPVVRRQAEELAMGFRNKYQEEDPERRILGNHYVVITDDREYLARYPSVNRRHYDAAGKLVREDDPNLPDVPLWTDHFSSLTPIELAD